MKQNKYIYYTALNLIYLSQINTDLVFNLKNIDSNKRITVSSTKKHNPFIMSIQSINNNIIKDEFCKIYDIEEAAYVQFVYDDRKKHLLPTNIYPNGSWSVDTFIN